MGLISNGFKGICKKKSVALDISPLYDKKNRLLAVSLIYLLCSKTEGITQKAIILKLVFKLLSNECFLLRKKHERSDSVMLAKLAD